MKIEYGRWNTGDGGGEVVARFAVNGIAAAMYIIPHVLELVVMHLMDMWKAYLVGVYLL